MFDKQKLNVLHDQNFKLQHTFIVCTEFQFTRVLCFSSAIAKRTLWRDSYRILMMRSTIVYSAQLETCQLNFPSCVEWRLLEGRHFLIIKISLIDYSNTHYFNNPWRNTKYKNNIFWCKIKVWLLFGKIYRKLFHLRYTCYNFKS